MRSFNKVLVQKRTLGCLGYYVTQLCRDYTEPLARIPFFNHQDSMFQVSGRFLFCPWLGWWSMRQSLGVNATDIPLYTYIMFIDYIYTS